MSKWARAKWLLTSILTPLAVASIVLTFVEYRQIPFWPGLLAIWNAGFVLLVVVLVGLSE